MRTFIRNGLVIATAFALGHSVFVQSPRPRNSQNTPPAVASASRESGDRKSIPTLNSFDWKSVEATNYFDFVSGLRAVHCPEATIRDIVFMDLLRSSPPTAAAGSVNDAGTSRSSGYLDIIQMMDQLLGPGAGATTVALLRSPKLADFTGNEGMRTKLAALEVMFEMQHSQLFESNTGEPPPRTLVDQAEELKRVFWERVQTELTPDEYAAYRYRESPMPAVIRQEAGHLGLSSDDAKRIFNIEDKFETDSSLAEADPASALRDREIALRNALGPERAQEYLNARSPSYQEARAYGNQVGLAEGTVQSLTQFRNVYESTQGMDQIGRLEIRENVQRLLGPMFDHYLHHGGYWLDD